MNRYEIRVGSLLDHSWKASFGIASLEHEHGRCETILRGRLDQAQLYGLLNQLHHLGLHLVAVNIIGTIEYDGENEENGESEEDEIGK